MNKKILITMILGIFLITLASASPSFFVPRDTAYNLTFNCEDETQTMSYCASGTVCNLTVFYVNHTALLDNVATTNLNNGNFYYQLSVAQTSILGEYSGTVGCSGNGLNNSVSFSYLVNSAGVRPSESRTSASTRSIYFVFIIGLLLFVSSYFAGKKSKSVAWTLFIFGLLFSLIGLNLISVGMQDEVVNPRLITFFDQLTAISTIMYWFAAGLLIVIWILTLFNKMVLKQNTKKMERFGGSS